jgi:hypothetical protein
VALVLADVLLALLGAGPPSVGLWQRVFANILLSLVATLACVVLDRLLLRATWLAQRRWALAALVIAAMILLMGPATWVVAAWLAPPARLSDLLTYMGTWATILPVVALFGPIASAVRRVIVDIEGRDSSQPHPAKFLQRLPPELHGAKLWAIEAQDHYLRLHTSKGRSMILMRMADALAELEGLEGARVHRSWWVTRDAITGVSRAKGRAMIRLREGGDIPVSRTYASELRERGWL